MILSYHPCYVGDENRLCAGRHPDAGDAAAMRRASAVILPQGCYAPLFEMAAANCVNVFPDYTQRFRFPGKIGQADLFGKFGAPHPKTLCFQSLDTFYRCHQPVNPQSPFGYPFVFKFTWSGEGENVWRVDNEPAFQTLLETAARFETTGQKGFLLQQYVETGGRSLRVVIINETCISYWRLQTDPNRFGSQFAQGGRLDHHAYPDQQEKARTTVIDFCERTGINLAGFDIIFQEDDPGATPLFLEINYYFGRRGLGGSETYYRLVCGEIDHWISSRLHCA